MNQMLSPTPSQKTAGFDWLTILLYLVLVLLGWFSIYAANYDESQLRWVDLSQEHGRQMVWIATALGIAFLTLFIDSKFFAAFSLPIYVVTMLLLVGVLFFGREVHASRSWFELGGVRLQPAEFAKFATCLAVAYIMSRHNFRISQWKNLFIVGLVLAIPAGLILLQNDTGSALVYSAFILTLYREGMHWIILFLFFAAIILFVLSVLYSPLTVLLTVLGAALLAAFFCRVPVKVIFRFAMTVAVLFSLVYVVNMGLEGTFSEYSLLFSAFGVCSAFALVSLYRKKLYRMASVLLITWGCIGFCLSVDYVFDHLQQHQQDRISILLGLKEDPAGVGYNVIQSKIAIGSGGFAGKGYLQGTQNRYNFLPIKSTDFIFSIIGEEWGFGGCTVVILLFLTLLLRILYMAERQRSDFSRIYGYGVASLLFFHMAINIGMTIGLAPVIGIPLPFFSYGGSSLWAFTILLFIFIRLDANRLQVFK